MLIYQDKSPFIQNILLIDSTIENYQEVVESVNNNTMAIVYDYNCTFEDLSNILMHYYTYRLGIFCHLNAPFFNNQSIYTDVSGMIQLIQHLNIKNIDFLSCSTLNSDEYKIFYEKLPCIVGASNDATGNIKYGGNWIMESTGEDIESIYFTKKIEYYTYLLVVTVASTPFKFNLNGTMIDINNILINSTDNINKIGNTNYNIKSNNVDYELGILYQNSLTLKGGIKTNYYIFINGEYRDISNYFDNNLTFYNNYLSVNNPIPSAAILTVQNPSTPSRIYYNWLLSLSGNDGICTIYGIGEYYLVINGMVTPYYSTNVETPVILRFIYFKGTNTIEIFTNGSIVAQFDTSDNTIYTSLSWPITPIGNNFINNVTSGDITQGTFIPKSTGDLRPIQGGVNVIKYSTKGANSPAYSANTSGILSTAYFLNTYDNNLTFTTNKYISAYIYKPSASDYNNTANKIVGYFRPPVTETPASIETWTFDIRANDAAFFQIGVSSNKPSQDVFSYTPIRGSSAQCMSWSYIITDSFPTDYSMNSVRITSNPSPESGSTRSGIFNVSNQARVQLTQGLYYPILLHYGQTTENSQLSLDITNINTEIKYTQSTRATEYKNLFYYLSSFPTY